jgi:D-alanyl-D-alanine carboxypeptidase
VALAAAISAVLLGACGGDDAPSSDSVAPSTTSIVRQSSTAPAPVTAAPLSPEPPVTESTVTESTVAVEQPMAPERVAALRSILDAHDTGDEFVGAVVAVRDAAGATVTLTAGRPSLDESEDVDPTVAWNVGSVTKTFVAVVVLQLAEEGVLDLDVGIDAWFPGLPDAASITPRHLLQHTSGLAEYIDEPGLDMARDWDPMDLVAIAEMRGRLGTPGEKHAYSNTNYLLLGQMIERVTGNAWHVEVASRIGEPLGLQSTSPVEGDAQAPAHSLGVDGWTEVTDLTDPSIGGAAGALESTARDLLAFTDALAAGELLPPALQQQMETFVAAQDYSEYGVDHRYGLGVEFYATDEVSVTGHMGVGAGQSAFIGFDRRNGTSVAVQFNTDVPGPQAILAIELLTALAD